MSKKVILSILAICSVIVMGCAGDNQEACEDYVDAYNDLDCASGSKLDKEATCPEELNDDECDMEAYYDCLTEETTCNDGKVSAPSAGKCTKDCEEE